MFDLITAIATIIVAIVAVYISYKVFKYTKLRDIPHLSVEIVNMRTYSEDQIQRAEKKYKKYSEKYANERIEDMRKSKEPKLVFKNLGNEELKAMLEVYLYEAEGLVDMERLTDSKICSKLKKVEPDLKIALNLQPKEIYDSYLYGVIEACTTSKMRELIEKEVNVKQQEKEEIEEEIKKRIREGQYFNSQKPHLVIFKGKYESALGGGEVKEFCKSFRLIFVPSHSTINKYDEWIILSNNIQFKAVYPQKKICSELFKK